MVMGRDSGMIALGSAYGQPDIILVPESPIEFDLLVERVLAIFDVQKHVVLCVSEGIVNRHGQSLGEVTAIRRIRPAWIWAIIASIGLM